MDGIGAVRVVLGEGEPGILRLVLEAEGFQVVGQARGEAELRRVLDVTRPSVIVLDAGISAQAALEARGRGSGTALVVVWPMDVVPALADERVDPSSVLQELGAAVRRAARRAPTIPTESVVIIPDLPSVGSEPTVPRSDAVRRIHPAAPARSRRRGGVLIATALTVALTASAAIGLVVPRAMRNFHLFEGGRAPAAGGAGQPSTDRVDPDAHTRNGSNDDRDCGRADERAEAPRTDPGKPEAAGTCGKGQGRPEHAGSSGATDKGNKGGGSQGGGGNGVGNQDGVTNDGGNGGGDHGNGGGGKQDGASQDFPTDEGSASGADGGGSGDPTSHGKATGRSGDEASGGDDHPGNSGGKP